MIGRDFRFPPYSKSVLSVDYHLLPPFCSALELTHFDCIYVLYIQFTVAYSRSTYFKWRKPTDLQWRWQSRWTKDRRGTRENRRRWIWTRPQSAISNGQDHIRYFVVVVIRYYFIVRTIVFCIFLCKLSHCAIVRTVMNVVNVIENCNLADCSKFKQFYLCIINNI